MKGNNGFTLIELIAVLVIMAILALIVTPLVMSIIKKAKVSADKRSIDAYGRSIELAIASYLLDNGTFPNDISQLTIEYSGDEVICSTTQLNSDSSVYLEDCTVGGRSVDYTYGADTSPTYQAYSVGDEVSYNGVNYYVIKASGAKDESVTLLKAEPLSVAEVNQYGVGHVNRYTPYSQGTAKDTNGYGGMAYYTSETCGYENNHNVYDGCTSNYEQSEIKYVVDGWKATQAPLATEARLVTYDELIDNLGYDPTISSSGNLTSNENVPSWVYNRYYNYWTMTQHTNSNIGVWIVRDDELYRYSGISDIYTVRPVIVLSKTVLH